MTSYEKYVNAVSVTH